MNIDKKKCIEWCELALLLMKKAKNLNKSEKEYILANFSIAFGRLTLQS